MTGKALRVLTLAILDRAMQPNGYSWSVQGFGLLRLYIRNVGRLHIWDSTLRYPGVSMIHNHSWDLHSTVIAGRLRNRRYTENWECTCASERPFMKQRLVTGYETRMLTQPQLVWLYPHAEETYEPFNHYNQRASEIHLTDADDGTVTLMARQEDVEGHADVYWPQGCSWGTARPRGATVQEIETTVAKAIAKLEAEL